MTTVTRPQPCHYAVLLGAVFSINPDDLLITWGFSARPQSRYVCTECGKRSGRIRKGGLCRQCQHEQALIMVTCEECRRVFPRREKTVVYAMGRQGYNHIWCSKVCQGKWLGREHGYATRPDHKKRPRKYDYDAIWAAHVQTGYRGTQLAPLLGISISTINKILAQRNAGGIAEGSRP